MKILNVRRQTGGNTIARFDAELPCGVRLYNIALKRTGAGLRVFAPSAFGCAAATFTTEFASALIGAAMGEIDQHGTNTKAA